MQETHAPNTDPLPSTPAPATCCARSIRKTARWTPYGSRSAPPTTRRDSSLRNTPGYTLPPSPELTPASGPSIGPKSHPTTVEEIPESTTCGEKQEHVGHEKAQQDVSHSKNEKKYEYTDDFIDVMLGILSLIYCSPLLIAGGRTFVIPQNFSSQPPPVQTHDPTSTTAIGQHKPNHMRWFIERLLERTRPPRAVCQLAVAYLLSVSDAVQNELRAAAEARLRRAATYHHPPLALPVPRTASAPTLVPMSAPPTPETPLPPPYSAEPPAASLPAFASIGMPPMHLTLPHPAPVSALLDPRRVMLAAMVLAHKFHLDKTWTNKAWAKVSGLEAREVGRCERTVAIALGHRLWAGRV